ncbi:MULTISPECIES: RDD family protein [Mycolicibacterium]|uniref:RDD domain containing protein n=1 Tax=Mycolicibacterium gilvum (strain PYR-GCK) TaxID=350054 RepID=A4T9B9_MYCGI|nr:MULTISPECIES: RDD family protein [Mycolicibacterium]ABP44523.1 RDD domain containing protein [Mycolicibacterium gilvum PYR-GCK]MBV5244121.1 RDD family protein [Mycolicibacterium sp. PAM1]
MRTAARNPHTSWTRRVAAGILDAVPVMLGWGIWESVAIGAASTECVTYDNGGVACTAIGSPAGDVVGVLMVFLSVAYLCWNFGLRQGRRGASIGKSVMGFRMVDEKTWQAVGFGRSMLRLLVHVVDAVPLGIGFLFPLWDRRRQTLADKLMGTVCVPVQGTVLGTRR